MSTIKSAAPLSTDMIEKLSTIRRGRPCYLLARQIGLSTDATTRALAGLPVYRATRFFLEQRINELTGEGAHKGADA